jgi:hypothetical protein
MSRKRRQIKVNIYLLFPLFTLSCLLIINLFPVNNEACVLNKHEGTYCINRKVRGGDFEEQT